MVLVLIVPGLNVEVVRVDTAKVETNALVANKEVYILTEFVLYANLTFPATAKEASGAFVPSMLYRRVLPVSI
jgi:hypothetical protein